MLTVALALGLQAASGSLAIAQTEAGGEKAGRTRGRLPLPQPQPQAPAQGEQQQPVQLIYSPWTKFCLKNQDDPIPSRSASPARTPASNPACRWSPPC